MIDGYSSEASPRSAPAFQEVKGMIGSVAGGGERGNQSMAKSNAVWEAESDFRSLAGAEEVKSDRTRLAKAKKAGQKIIREEKKALIVKQKVAKPAPKKVARPAPKRARRPRSNTTPY